MIDYPTFILNNLLFVIIGINIINIDNCYKHTHEESFMLIP
jgi:hypothetical protein